MSDFKRIPPCISRISSSNKDNNYNNNSHLQHTHHNQTVSSTNRHPLGLERTETNVVGMTELVQPQLNIGHSPLYKKGQVVLFCDLFLLIKMVFKNDKGVWSYAVETEDGMRRVIDESSITVPKEIGHKKQTYNDISVCEVSNGESPPLTHILVNSETTQKVGKKGRRSKRRNHRWKRKAKRKCSETMSQKSYGYSQSSEIGPLTSDIDSICDELSFVSHTFFEITDPPKLGGSSDILDVNESNIERCVT